MFEFAGILLNAYGFGETLEGIAESIQSIKDMDIKTMKPNKRGYIRIGGWNDSGHDESTGSGYYIDGRPEGGNPREDQLIRKNTLKIKSDSFKDFLIDQGEDPNQWRKICETWENSDGDFYERHYWTNGTKSYYHL